MDDATQFFFLFLTDVDPFDFLLLLALWQLETFSGLGLFRNMRTKGFNQSCRFLGSPFYFIFYEGADAISRIILKFFLSHPGMPENIYGPVRVLIITKCTVPGVPGGGYFYLLPFYFLTISFPFLFGRGELKSKWPFRP